MKKDFSPALLDFGPLQIYLARHFGFCYGVENAIDIAFRTIEENPGKRIFLLSEMEKKSKPLFWLGEFDLIENPEYFEVFDTAYTWVWMRKTEEFYKGHCDLQALKNSLLHYEDICRNGNIPAWFTSNHDENSWNGTEFEKYGDMALPLAVFSCTWTGMPLIYSGQELPNTKRLKFFEKDQIGWGGQYQLQEFYKTLLQLRKRNGAIAAGDATVATNMMETNAPGSILAFHRKKDEQEVCVVLNFSNQPVEVIFISQQPSGSFIELFGKMEIKFPVDVPLHIMPWGYLVFEKDNGQA